MIVPQNRLLFCVGMILPLVALAPSVPSLVIWTIAAVVLILMVVSVDAVLARRNARSIRVSLSKLVRLSKDQSGSIPLEIQSKTRRRLHLRLGLPFPREIETEEEGISALIPGIGSYRVLWNCTPKKRGRFLLEKIYVEVPSRLGFLSMRTSFPAHLEIRVYPNLMEERKRVAAFFLTRGDSGIHSFRMLGQGREFEKLREYMPGDSYDQIHWKATARRGRPITKVFQIERTQEVYIILDSSRLTAREIQSETVLEHFLKSALILGMVAQQQGDLFGVLTFSDKVQNFLRAGNGKAHYQACREALYGLQPRTVTPDFDDLCTFIRLRLRRRALLVILTDLNDPVLAESFVRSADLIAGQHLILVNMMKPPSARPLFSEPNVDSLDSFYTNLGGHMLWQNLRDLQNVLHRHGISLAHVESGEMSAALVAQYMNVKQRQLL